MSIIAISRGTFSGGEALAKAVASRLGYRCLSREVILEAAWGYGVPADEMIRAMEKRPHLWERLAGERAVHLTLMRAALCEHARGGNLVYHGHVGHLLLPGITHVIRVRVIADMEYRIQAAMKQQGLSREAAGAFIEKVDKERREWTRFLFDVDWDDARLYDAVLNLSRVGLATASEIVVRLAGDAEFKPTATSVKALQDLALSSRVSAILATDTRTKGADLTVTADDGHITVSGITGSRRVMEAIPLVAGQADGIKEVLNDVRTVVSSGRLA